MSCKTHTHTHTHTHTNVCLSRFSYNLQSSHVSSPTRTSGLLIVLRNAGVGKRRSTAAHIHTHTHTHTHTRTCANPLSSTCGRCASTSCLSTTSTRGLRVTGSNTWVQRSCSSVRRCCAHTYKHTHTHTHTYLAQAYIRLPSACTSSVPLA